MKHYDGRGDELTRNELLGNERVDTLGRPEAMSDEWAAALEESFRLAERVRAETVRRERETARAWAKERVREVRCG